MLKQLKKITVRLIAIVNIFVVVLMLLVGFSDRFVPADYPLLAVSGLLFPVVLAANLFFLVLWLLFYWRGAAIPLLGFLLCYVPVRTYIPFNLKQDIPADAIKVLTYNVYLFAGWEYGQNESNRILEYIRDSDADIACLQEALSGEEKAEVIDSMLNPRYPYRNVFPTRSNSGTCHRLYSKFPILSAEEIPYESASNGSVAYVLDVRGEKVLVVSNHLESIKFSPDEKNGFKGLVKGEYSEDEAKAESRSLKNKICSATVRRAPEAEAVVEYIREKQRQGFRVIACGDFNDSPISYARRQFARVLTDCYVATGNGPGFSYHNNAMYVRIDHLFCSDDFIPFGAVVDPKVKDSDHYPLYCWLKMRPKS